MSTSRGNYFYKELTSLTSDYKDAGFDFKFTSRHVKIAVEGGNLEFSLTGSDGGKVDGLVKPTDGVLIFDGLEAARIALRQKSGTVSLVRIWAYK